jgi:hypothetical protein
MQQCEEHGKLITDIVEIKTIVKYISERMVSHIEEGEKPKIGFRDRIIILEQEVSALKQAEWGRVIAAGVIGGLIGNLSPDLIKGLLWLVGIRG